MQRIKARNSWNLLIKSFDISLMLTLSSKLWIFLSFSSLRHLNSLKDVVLNQNSKKIKGPYQFPLDPLNGINSPLFLKFVPLSKKLLVKSFDLVSFNNHFLSLPITQVRVYYSHMLVKIHQFSSMNVQHPFVITLDIQTCA